MQQGALSLMEYEASSFEFIQNGFHLWDVLSIDVLVRVATHKEPSMDSNEDAKMYKQV